MEPENARSTWRSVLLQSSQWRIVQSHGRVAIVDTTAFRCFQPLNLAVHSAQELKGSFQRLW